MAASPRIMKATVGIRPNLKRPGKGFYLFALVLLVVAAAGLAYYYFVYLPAHAVQVSSMMQTASVRQGNLILSATGSGTLTAPEEAVTFTEGGDMLVTAVDVKAGDLVQSGDVLAVVDSRQAQSPYDDAKQNYLDLTSATAVAQA